MWRHSNKLGWVRGSFRMKYTWLRYVVSSNDQVVRKGLQYIKMHKEKMYSPHCLALRENVWETQDNSGSQERDTGPTPMGSFNAPVPAGSPQRGAPRSHSMQCQEIAKQWQRSRATPSRSPGPRQIPAMWFGSWTGLLPLAAGWDWGENGFPWHCEKEQRQRKGAWTTHSTHFRKIQQQPCYLEKPRQHLQEENWHIRALIHSCTDVCICMYQDNLHSTAN